MKAINAFVILLPGVLLLVFWETVTKAVPRLEFFFGSPSSIVREAKHLLETGTLLHDFSVTAGEALAGFALGSILGSAVGLCLWYSRRVYDIASPYILALGSLPIFALGPMLIFWFGTGFLSKVVLAFLSTFAIAVVQAYTGASEADPNLIRLLRVFGANRGQMFTKLIAPSAIIWVLAGVRINIGMALLGAFIGEFIASRSGLGHLIIVAEGLFNVSQIWVGIFGILLIALVFQSLTTPVERWARRWQPYGNRP